MQRTTVLLDADLHRALKLRAAAPGAPSVSQQINEALRQALAEDEADASRIRRVMGRTKAGEWVSYEQAIRELKKRGRL